MGGGYRATRRCLVDFALPAGHSGFSGFIVWLRANNLPFRKRRRVSSEQLAGCAKADAVQPLHQVKDVAPARVTVPAVEALAADVKAVLSPTARARAGIFAVTRDLRQARVALCKGRQVNRLLEGLDIDGWLAF